MTGIKSIGHWLKAIGAITIIVSSWNDYPYNLSYLFAGLIIFFIGLYIDIRLLIVTHRDRARGVCNDNMPLPYSSSL